ncbi:MAG: hypothetical protein KJ725_07285 [Gammaproteobacteria bacterium]|nr:hypothetical protein [Gammaproteobacteria bacterium]
MSYDHYQEAEELISMLENVGLKYYGESLQRAMDEGATGTEIFMSLRWYIGQFLAEVSVDDVIKAKAKRLLNELDKALQ